MTTSIGVASLDSDQSLPLDGLINGADQAMYLAKQQGRNRVAAWIQKEPEFDPELAQLGATFILDDVDGKNCVRSI